MFSQPQLEMIELIGDHFLAKKIGWFLEYHFLELPGLKPKYKALLVGGKDGPISKMAWSAFYILVQCKASQRICLPHLILSRIFW